jgi:hypothetical protein
MSRVGSVCVCEQTKGVGKEWNGRIKLVTKEDLFFLWRTSVEGRGRPHFRGFTVILRHTTLGRTPLDE